MLDLVGKFRCVLTLIYRKPNIILELYINLLLYFNGYVDDSYKYYQYIITITIYV